MTYLIFYGILKLTQQQNNNFDDYIPKNTVSVHVNYENKRKIKFKLSTTCRDHAQLCTHWLRLRDDMPDRQRVQTLDSPH